MEFIFLIYFFSWCPKGPRGDPPKADLRNLSLIWADCDEDDLIFMVSDGVYDNLDPRHLGLKPCEVGIPGDQTWNDVDSLIAAEANCQFIENKLTAILNELGDNLQAQTVCQTLTDFCLGVTEQTRQFMIQNPSTRLPKDYSLYPGKVDHTTVICFRVSPVSLSYDQWMGK